MVPAETPRDGDTLAAGDEARAGWPPITEEEWQALLRRSLLPRPAGVEAGAADDGTPNRPVAPAASEDGAGHASSPGVGEPVPPMADAALPVWTRRRPQEPDRAALTEEEWRERFFQRGKLTGLAEGDDLLILTAPDIAGGVTTLRLSEDALTAVAAAALRQAPTGFDWQDHDDIVLLRQVLDSWLCGLQPESRPSAEREAIAGLAERCSGLIARLAALLPPR